MKLQRFKKLLQISGIVTGLAVVAFAIGTLFNINSTNAAASDCSANAIMHCGTASASDFIAKVRSGNGGAQNDLPTIYSSYGLTSADYNRFITSAQPGTAYKDGRIVVGGRVVATGAESIGRSQKSYSHAKVIGGTTYWESSAQDVFLSDSIPVLVLFNAQGQMQFAVMTDCGNPTHGQPVTPTYACNNLATRQIDRTTYAFSTSASAGNGATINHVVYDFGDGTSSTQTNPATEVTHTYAKEGNYSAKVTVYVNVPNAATAVVAPAGNCVKQITVTPPPATPVAACTLLTITPTDNRLTFNLTATASATGGATISGYHFYVRNGSQTIVEKLVPSTATTASTQLTVPNGGDYAAQVYVNTSLGTLTSGNCMKPLSAAPAPVASCSDLNVLPLDRTTYKLTGEATVSGGATVQGYDFTVKDANGTTVASPAVNTGALTASANVTASDAGKYTATLSVRTSVGAKTGSACTASFTVPEKPISPVPSIKIEKDVDGVKQETVTVGQVFTYHVTVTNDGKVDLTNAAVTDTPPAGVTLLSADQGSIAGNKWSFTIPSLKIGDHVTFALTGRVDTYVAGNLVNTACVTAPAVNPNQPLCDTATVVVTPPATPTPPVLPNTGAGNVVSVFAATVVVAALGYRFWLGRRLSRS